MCDTIVATARATADGSVILAKNSDREANETQLLEYYPARSWPEGSSLRCTYISIPQVRETHEILISRPFWMWGCEMGVNEHGLAIGNEAVFTREPYEKTGLLGMDLIRLALERCRTAHEAMRLTAELIERHGQGGNAGMAKKLYYHNSFIFADPAEAYVLETAGRHWVALRVDGVYSISNGLTIGEEFHFSSKNIEDYARRKGYLKKGKNFNFRECFSDKFYTHFSRCRVRRSRTMDLTLKKAGSISPETMFEILRDHGHDDFYPAPDKTNMGTVCMHASLWPTRPSQSVAALVVHLRRDLPVYWATGSSGICTSVFMPFYLAGKAIDYFPDEESGTFTPRSYWWQHEKIHRQAIFKWDYFQKYIAPKMKGLESEFLKTEAELYQKVKDREGGDRLIDFSRECVEKVLLEHQEWEKELSLAPEKAVNIPFKLFWKNQNRKAKLEF